MGKRGRKENPLTKWRVLLRKDKKYRYAVTQEYSLDEKIGKKKQHYLQWGTVTDDMTFIPGPRYKLATKDVRDKLIFPDNWDLNKILSITGEEPTDSGGETHDATVTEDQEDSVTEQQYPAPVKNGAPDPIKTQDRCSLEDLRRYNTRLYGAVWMFEGLADNCGLMDDLIVTMEMNAVVANEILALAVYPYIGRKSYSRFARWQAVYKTQVSTTMTAPYITKLSQSITDNHRMTLIRKRIDRLPEKSLSGMDSTTRSAWGECLADIRWGVNKDNRKLRNTVEVYVYSLTVHEPIYYRSFAGNTMDMSTVRTVLSDLVALGFDRKEIGIITDRGYPSNDNLGNFVAAQIPFIMCSKVNRKPISQILLNEVKYDQYGLPTNFEYDAKRNLYYAQFIVPKYTVLLSDNTPVDIDGLKVNLFLSMSERNKEIQKILDKVLEEETAITKVVKDGHVPSDLKVINSCYNYYKLEREKNDQKQIHVIKKEDRIDKDISQCGFFSSLMYIIDMSAKEALDTYKMRDEEEKCHELIKDQLEFNTQDASTEESKDGRSFILFCGAILASKLRYGWKNTNLSIKYPSSLDVMDVMEPIKYSEYASEDNPSHMTTFTEEQFLICQCLGLTPPRDCLTSTTRETYDRVQRLKEAEAAKAAKAQAKK